MNHSLEFIVDKIFFNPVTYLIAGSIIVFFVVFEVWKYVKLKTPFAYSFMLTKIMLSLVGYTMWVAHMKMGNILLAILFFALMIIPFALIIMQFEIHNYFEKRKKKKVKGGWVNDVNEM